MDLDLDLDLNSTWTLDLDFGLGLTWTWTWIVTISLFCAGSSIQIDIFFLYDNDVLDEVLIAWTMLELLETR